MSIGSVREVGPREVREWMAAGRAVLVDVREEDEHAAERIEGAVLAPLSRFDPTTVPASEGRHLVMHCTRGGRSLQAAQAMAAAGRGEVFSMAGGITAWREAGLPVRSGTKRARMPVLRQVQIAVGSMVLVLTVLGAFVSAWFLVGAAFFGAGLVFAGVTGWCGMAALLGRMWWNR